MDRAISPSWRLFNPFFIRFIVQSHLDNSLDRMRPVINRVVRFLQLDANTSFALSQVHSSRFINPQDVSDLKSKYSGCGSNKLSSLAHEQPPQDGGFLVVETRVPTANEHPACLLAASKLCFSIVASPNIAIHGRLTSSGKADSARNRSRQQKPEVPEQYW